VGMLFHFSLFARPQLDWKKKASGTHTLPCPASFISSTVQRPMLNISNAQSLLLTVLMTPARFMLALLAESRAGQGLDSGNGHHRIHAVMQPKIMQCQPSPTPFCCLQRVAQDSSQVSEIQAVEIQVLNHHHSSLHPLSSLPSFPLWAAWA